MALVRRLVLAALIGVSLICAPPATAQPTELEQTVADYGRWSVRAQTTMAALFEPFERVPIYPAVESRSNVEAWRKAVHSWIAEMRLVISVVRAEVASMPPPPGPADFPLHKGLEAMRSRMPAIIGGVEDFTNRLEQAVNALVTGDGEGAIQRAELAYDSLILSISNARDVATLQVQILEPTHPQAALLQAGASGYDAMIGMMKLDREALRGEPASRPQCAAALRANVATIRGATRKGRPQAAGLIAMLARPGVLGFDNEAMRVRAKAAYETLPAAFDIEDAFAAEIETVAALLEGAEDYEALTPQIDAAMNRLAALDKTRADGHLARAKALQGP